MRLVGVHGVGKHRLGRHRLLAEWVPALADGVERAAGHPVAAPDLDLAFYGDVFLPAEAGGRKGADDGDAFADLTPVDVAELEAGAVEAFGADAVAAAEQEAAKGRTRVPLPLQAVLRLLDGRFGAGAGLLHLGVFRQVRRYLGTPELKAAVDARVAQVVGPRTRVLIGHSLGSVVAYEFVRQHPDTAPDLLVTLGSPLGLRWVRGGLPPSAPIRPTWVNVRDPRDPVTCAGPLDRWWPAAADRTVDNGPEAHAVDSYLGTKQTGRTLLEILPDLGRR